MDRITELQEMLKAVKPSLQEEYGLQDVRLSHALKANGSYSMRVFVQTDHSLGWRFFTLEQRLCDALRTKVELVPVYKEVSPRNQAFYRSLF